MRHVTALFVALCLVPFASAQVPTDTQLQELLTVSGAREVMQASLEQGMTSFPAGTPTRFVELFKEELKVDSLLAPTLQLYREHLTAPEIAKLIQFYQSPAGQKLVKFQPQLTVAAQKVGQAYGERAAQRALKRFQAEQQPLLKQDD